jgi:hypothetical protein
MEFGGGEICPRIEKILGDGVFSIQWDLIFPRAVRNVALFDKQESVPLYHSFPFPAAVLLINWGRSSR